jgi:flagellar hook-associated protein 1 FlgK
MSGLFDSLRLTANALDAQRLGLDVVGQNLANVNTPGYTRRVIDLASIPPDSRLSAGRGVEVVAVRSVRDALVERRLRQEIPLEQRHGAAAEVLAVVESGLGAPGESIDGALTAFFDAFGRLSEDPLSSPARQEVVRQGQALASSFHDVAGRLTAAQRDADARVRAGLDTVNALADQVASLNRAIGRAGSDGPETDDLKDRLSESVKALAVQLDVRTVARADGGLDVTFGNGRVLVAGGKAYAVAAVSGGPSGFAAVVNSEGVTVTGEIAGGRIAGYLSARDTLIPGYLSRLDTLAHTVVGQVNTLHDAGFDRNGAAAGVFFDALGSVSGAAAAISVASAVAADPGLVAAAGTAAVGDNQAARGIAALRGARVLDGGQATFHDSWATLVFQAGRDSKRAQDDQRSYGDVVRQIETLRDQVSGVSLDEETAQLMKFQRAYEANARFFRLVDDTIETLMNMV